MRVYIGLGSNLDGPRERLTRAVESLRGIPETSVADVSSYYRSKPVGPQGQPDFVNAVAALDTKLDALELLGHLQSIENSQNRDRTGQRWGPRTLDLDILLYGDQRIDTDDLKVPHPEMHRRGFVLLPLSEIAPQLTIPGSGPVTELLSRVDTTDLQKITAR